MKYPIYTFEETYSLNSRTISGAFAENLKYIVNHGDGYYTLNERKVGLYAVIAEDISESTALEIGYQV